MFISRSILLGMTNVSDESCRGNQNTYFMFNNVFPKNRAVYEIIGKILYSRTGHRWKCPIRIAC